MTETELLGPRAWGEACGSAMLKASAEDFQVDELLDIPLSGAGEHLWLWIEKRQLNTEEVARLLARAAKVPFKNISYAGLKDRQALTTQWFSIHLPGKDADVSSVESVQLRILQATRHTRKLQRGTHKANGFRIRLTQLTADRDGLDARLEQIQRFGVPNYFGAQRFGRDGMNVQHAAHYAERQELPPQRNVRSRLLSTARSTIFNRILAARVADGSWQQAKLGDLLTFTQSRSHFLAAEQELLDPRLQELDLHPSGALWGQGELATQGDVLKLEQQVAESCAQLCHWLEQAGLKQERRILRLPVSALSWCYPDENTLELRFNLPVGCYATAVIREIVELLPVDDVDVACEF